MTPVNSSGAPVIYIASPLFSVIERRWNRELAAAIKEAIPEAEVIIPQDFRVLDRYNDKRHWPEIFGDCIKAIDRADVVCALVDGPDADSGTSFEMGYAYKAGIPVIAIRTDFRQSQDRGVNIMLSQAADDMMLRMSFDEDPRKLAAEVAKRILRLYNSRRKR